MHTEGRSWKDQGEGGPLQIQEKDLRRNQPCQYFDLTLLVTRTVRKSISIVEAAQSEIFCYGTPS